MRSTVSGLRLLATDLGCAALQLGVGGLASGVSWLARRRQDAVAERAQRMLDIAARTEAERLAEAEAEQEVWEPQANRFSRDAIEALEGARWCYAHKSLYRDCKSEITVCRLGREPSERAAEPSSHGFSGQCPNVGRMCNCTGACLPRPTLDGSQLGGPVSAAVSIPAADNTPLADHITALLDYHVPMVVASPTTHSPQTWGCEGCRWLGSRAAFNGHLARLVADLVGAEGRVQQRMDGTR